MPELPEVETIKNDLKKRILRKKIVGIEIRKRKIIKNKSTDFIKILKGNFFSNLDRIGKLVICELADKKNFLLIHLKMTGQLIYCNKGEIVAGGHENTLTPPPDTLRVRRRAGSPLPAQAGSPILPLSGRMGEGGYESRKIPGVGDKLPGKHTHIIFKFKDGAELFFNDLRQFGYFKMVNKEELEKIVKDYGIEPLTKDFTIKKFREVLKNRKTSIKAVLLNQKLIAGIGNIYADESLFLAKIKPSRQAGSLLNKEIKELFKAISFIIKEAIKYRGTTFNNYVDTSGRKGNFAKLLKVYKREGGRCLRCPTGTIIKKKIAGRGTRYCDKCQK